MPLGALMLEFAGKLGRDFRAVLDEAFRARIARLRQKRN
jgi:hypothetical protein